MSDKVQTSEYKKLAVKNGDLTGAIQSFVSELLTQKKVAAVLVPQRTPTGGMVFPALISDPSKLAVDPIAPVLPVATAALVMTLTREGPLSQGVAVFMRSCQIRALIELAKLKQANLNNIVVIGMDCPGTFSINDYTDINQEKGSNDLFRDLLEEKNGMIQRLRSACLGCKDPTPGYCDILMGMYGMDLKSEILIEIRTSRGREIIQGLSLMDASASSKRDRAISELTEKRRNADRKFREEFSSIKGIEEILKFYAKCINCQNCRRVCPICYCQECFFCSDNLSQTADNLVRKSQARGAFKMPLDTLLFHTGRMNHMILSCVECGLCQQACPVNIPLMRVLKRVAYDAQAKFGYSPGRNLDEEIPLKVFQENEFTEVGEE
jgi:formate dehydrogenase subunit beta